MSEMPTRLSAGSCLHTCSQAATRLRWMHAAGAGVERYDLAQIAARGVMLTNSSGVSAPNMAEHVLGMMIALTRRFPQLLRAQTRREWRDEATHREVGELQGQTVLVAGIGEIGRAVAQRAAAFGMRVNGLRRRADASPPAGFDQVFAIGDLHAALADADHVVVTLPNTPRSRGLFDAAAFAAMKPGAAIYNVGRGPVIDTAALIAALESGHLGGAGLDVTDPEPLPAGLAPLGHGERPDHRSHLGGHAALLGATGRSHRREHPAHPAWRCSAQPRRSARRVTEPGAPTRGSGSAKGA